jgi:hypothetical protein
MTTTKSPKTKRSRSCGTQASTQKSHPFGNGLPGSGLKSAHSERACNNSSHPPNGNSPPSLYIFLVSREPSNFNARAMARWLVRRGRPHAKRQPPGPRPTLADLQRSHCWTWVYCEKCLHHAPMALVPLIIRWGAEASSDRLRESAAALNAPIREQLCNIRMGGHAHRVSAIPFTCIWLLSC